MCLPLFLWDMNRMIFFRLLKFFICKHHNSSFLLLKLYRTYPYLFFVYIIVSVTSILNIIKKSLFVSFSQEYSNYKIILSPFIEEVYITIELTRVKPQSTAVNIYGCSVYSPMYKNLWLQMF